MDFVVFKMIMNKCLGKVEILQAAWMQKFYYKKRKIARSNKTTKYGNMKWNVYIFHFYHSTIIPMISQVIKKMISQFWDIDLQIIDFLIGI